MTSQTRHLCFRRRWNAASFTFGNVFTQQHAPIADDAIVTLDAHTGRPLSRWGRNEWFMPHGIHVDGDHVWLTDVALHQVGSRGRVGRKAFVVTVVPRPVGPGRDRETFFCCNFFMNVQAL